MAIWPAALAVPGSFGGPAAYAAHAEREAAANSDDEQSGPALVEREAAGTAKRAKTSPHYCFCTISVIKQAKCMFFRMRA